MRSIKENVPNVRYENGLGLNEDQTQTVNFSADTRINKNQIKISSSEIAMQKNKIYFG